MELIKETKKDISWQKIKEVVEKGVIVLRFGNSLTGIILATELKNGEKQEWVITDYGDDYIRFDARDCIKGRIHCMNKRRHVEGGIAASDMQKYLDTDIWDLLPDDLQAVISTVERKYWDGKEEKVYKTKLFLPSSSEICDERRGEHTLYQQLDYYKDSRNRIKQEEHMGVSAWYWLQSQYCGCNSIYCYVNEAGNVSANDPRDTCAVAPCFIIKRG